MPLKATSLFTERVPRFVKLLRAPRKLFLRLEARRHSAVAAMARNRDCSNSLLTSAHRCSRLAASRRSQRHGDTAPWLQQGHGYNVFAFSRTISRSDTESQNYFASLWYGKPKS